MQFPSMVIHVAMPFVAALAFLPGCIDRGSDLPPSPSGVTVSQGSVSLVAGDSVTLTISGGVSPYSVASQGNPGVTQASISGNLLMIRAVGIGTSVVVVQDNGSPPSQVSVGVAVTAVPVSFGAIIQPIFTTSCVVGCHEAGGIGPFSLSAGESFNNLVNVQSSVGSCTSEKRVLPGNAASSVLYRRVSDASCGTQMPRGNPPLPAVEIQHIADWINQGAMNN